MGAWLDERDFRTGKLDVRGQQLYALCMMKDAFLRQSDNQIACRGILPTPPFWLAMAKPLVIAEFSLFDMRIILHI